VSQLDLAPTLLDLAGLEAAPPESDGVSLAPVLRGTRGRGAPVVAEYLAEGVAAPMVMVRAGSEKLVRCPGDPDLVFDLADDPAELANLAEAEAERAGALGAEADRRWDLGALEAAVLAGQAERRVVVPALNRGRHTAWDYEPRPEASMRYVRSKADLYDLQRRARLDSGD
jgi:choline-sulfatase